MDKIDREYYQNIILIMTSNQKHIYFDALDFSYMRNGRVNLKFELNKDENVNKNVNVIND